jgi:hypothetical protein
MTETAIKLPSVEETQLYLVFPDGQELKADIVEIDELHALAKHLTKDDQSQLYDQFCELFKEEYDITLTKSQAYVLMKKKSERFDSLKKSGII